MGKEALSQLRCRPQSGRQLVSLSSPLTSPDNSIYGDDNIVIRLIVKGPEVTVANGTEGFDRFYDSDTGIGDFNLFDLE
jgi:hypothetical protein